MFYFNFLLFELLPSPHDAFGDISALQLEAYTANARIFFEGVILLAGRFGTQFLGLPLLLRLWMGLPQYIAQNQYPILIKEAFQIITKHISTLKTLTCTNSVNLLLSNTDLLRNDVSPLMNMRTGDIDEGAVRIE